MGQVVHINGMLKEADIETVGTTGAASSPEGGFDPLGQDLRLFEGGDHVRPGRGTGPLIARAGCS